MDDAAYGLFCTPLAPPVQVRNSEGEMAEGMACKPPINDYHFSGKPEN
jgi:hypothetical protein